MFSLLESSLGLFAADASIYTSILNRARNGVSSGNNQAKVKELYDHIDSVGHNAYQLLIGLVTVVILITLAIVGAKMAMASSGERPDAKARLVNIVIGTVLVFASVGIIGLVANTASSTFDESAFVQSSSASSASSGTQ